MEKEKIYCLNDLEVKESYTGLYDEYDIYYTPDKKEKLSFLIIGMETERSLER